MATTQFKSGQGGSVTVKGTVLKVTEWTFEPNVTLEETTHSGSAGFKESIAVIKSATGTVTFNWDADAKPTADPPNIVVGEVPLIKLNISDTGDFINIPCAIITDTSYTNPAPSIFVFTFSFEVTGPFTEPS